MKRKGAAAAEARPARTKRSKLHEDPEDSFDGDGDDLAHVTEGYGLNDLIADENADLEAWGDANGVDEEEYQVDAEHEQRSSRSKRGSKAGGSKGRKKAQKSPRMAYAATVGGSGSPAGPGGSSGGKVGLPELADAQQQLAALTQNQFGEDHVRRALEETRDSVLGPIEREQGGGQGAGTGAEGQPYGSGAAGVPENGNAGGGNAQGSGAQQPQGQGQDPGQGQLQQPGVEAGSGAGAGVGAGGSGAPAVLVSPAERQRLLHAWLEEAQMWLAVNQEVQGEVEDLRAAMQQSLDEAEERKRRENEQPLHQRPAARLTERFEGRREAGYGSAVLAALLGWACPAALFGEAGGHKAHVAKLVELECNCRRWYPSRGTELYFQQLAQDCRTAVAAAAAAAGCTHLEASGWVGCGSDCGGGAGAGPSAASGAAPHAQGSNSSNTCCTCAHATGEAMKQSGEGGAGAGAEAEPSAGTEEKAAGQGRQAGEQGGGGGGPSGGRVAVGAAAGAAVLAAVGRFCQQRGEQLEVEVCKMPSVSGAQPDVFEALEPKRAGEGEGAGGGEEEDDDVELL